MFSKCAEALMQELFDVIILFTQAEDSEFGGETQSERRSSGKAL